MSVGLADSDEDQNNIDGNYNGNIEDADLIDEIVAGFTGVLPANMFDEVFHQSLLKFTGKVGALKT